eukprot:CAMPEP_0175065160 /NCGR_PEP_ID=MMETSP0052_2-20121109/15757_1 /TAXON_ID=51329 ORGANISM="Polytomella parva, Strain SAG 63-3" /NCGR_SAMPLE_ID=MMETSP0052_2 /ASSEMBLY_ACC=CAM_ASM_000194 /LENGTH=188 /DNA_ID=CAMNT_0016331637 /DNA_START=39 /DNA_END=602 /DNA_ORIENTATION=+
MLPTSFGTFVTPQQQISAENYIRDRNLNASKFLGLLKFLNLSDVKKVDLCLSHSGRNPDCLGTTLDGTVQILTTDRSAAEGFASLSDNPKTVSPKLASQRRVNVAQRSVGNNSVQQRRYKGKRQAAERSRNVTAKMEVPELYSKLKKIYDSYCSPLAIVLLEEASAEDTSSAAATTAAAATSALTSSS